jgi:hypothetical protein
MVMQLYDHVGLYNRVISYVRARMAGQSGEQSTHVTK